MPDNNSNHTKRIAKNTMMLYLRMLITMSISLYTSRVVLEVLGVEDFGIYSVVGGAVGMVSFMISALSSSTSRFLTFEIGIGDNKNLKKVFNSALLLHIGLSIFILIICETLGLWFVLNKLTIPIDRIYAAVVVYQFSVLACIISIIRIPYNALIISHEKMNIFAYISILDSVLKLFIIYILMNVLFEDKLILYGFLVLIVTLLISLLYIFYCKRFKESKISFRLVNKNSIRPMLSFMGWDLYGNFSVMIRGQGINILQNIFFGPIVNAASTIATQVQNAISNFADSFLTAVRPRLVKNYAQKNIPEVLNLLFISSKFSFILLLLLSLPLILENKFVLSVWLVNVPKYAIVFCQLSLLNNLISVLFRPIAFTINATGNMMRISFINGTIYIMVLPISYFLLKLGFSPTTPYILNIILLFLGCVSNLHTLSLYINSFSILAFVKSVLAPCFIIAFLSMIIPYFIHVNMDQSWIRLLVVLLTSSSCILIAFYFIGLSKFQREFILIFIKKKLKNER